MTRDPELREPDLPRTAKVRKQALRTGWTTGTCASAAAKAATTALDTLAAAIKERKLWKHTLVLVGPALATTGSRSHLYHPGHFHGYRKAEPAARKQLRTRDKT